jgi:hypothetical protein
MLNPNSPTSPGIHEAAIRIARRCRRVVESCVPREHWAFYDLEFYKVLREELEELRFQKDAHPEGPAQG